MFDPNPVVKLQNQGLRDKNDAKSAVPGSAYSVVPLRRLKAETLKGRWVRIINKDRPFSATHTFSYSRANAKFEMVNAYYAVDAAQAYLRSLGFTDVNAESQKVLTDATPIDNSFYEPGSDRLLFGSGGVDDAEDVEVVWHEYGHAVQDDQVPGFGGSLRAGAIGEGFGDYLAVTMSQGNSADTATTPLACVMDWDATSYTSGNAALPAPHRRRQGVPRRPRGRGARRRRDLVARALGHEPGAGSRAREHGDHRGAVLVHAVHRVPGRRPAHRRHDAGAVRQRRGGTGPAGLRRPGILPPPV